MAADHKNFDYYAMDLAKANPNTGPGIFYAFIASRTHSESSSLMKTQDMKPSPLSQANSSASKASPLDLGSAVF